MQKLPSVFVGCGLVFLVLAVIIGWIAGPLVIEDQITRFCTLQNGTFVWNKWSKLESEMFIKLYLFNVTNPEEVESGWVPQFQQLGPFTYNEKRIKENIIYNEEKDTLTFSQPLWFYFREDLSVGSLNDVVTMINVPLVGISHKMINYSSWIRYLMGSFLTTYEEPLFIKRTVSQLLFEGYYSSMVDELQQLTGEHFFDNATVGFLVGRNGTSEGLFEINAGHKNSSHFGGLVTYNGKSTLSAWKEGPCNSVEGASDGQILPPFITKKSAISGFHPDACRTLKIKYAKDIEYHGVPGYRFETTEEQYLGPRSNPDNKCFCNDHEDDFSNCYYDGVISGRGCHKDFPVTISNPHFLYAPYYLNLTEGLNPDKGLHGTFVEMEPDTGLMFKAVRRMQLNLDLMPNRAIHGLQNVPTMQYPLIWAEEIGLMDDDILSLIQNKFMVAKSVLYNGRWVLLVTSLILIAGALSINVMRARKKPYI